MQILPLHSIPFCVYARRERQTGAVSFLPDLTLLNFLCLFLHPFLAPGR